MKQLKTKPSNRAITKNLFNNSNLEATPSSLIVQEVFSFCCGEGYLNHEKLDEYSSKIITKEGDIDFVLEQVKEKVEEYIVETYGLDTFKLFTILITQSLKQISNPNELITLRGKDILKLLNKDNQKDKSGNKRMSVEYSMDWVAKHVDIIKRMSIFIGKYLPKGKKSFGISQTNLVDIRERLKVYPLDKDGYYDRTKPVIDYEVTFAPGKWLEYFNDSSGIYLNQYGYAHKEVLASNTRNGWTEKIGLWLTTKLEQTRNNPNRGFKVRTIIEGIYEKANLDNILKESNSAKRAFKSKNLKKELETALENLTKFENPYFVEYKAPPSWIVNPKERKPKGWFDIWLELVIIIKKPDCLTVTAKKVPKPHKTQDKLSVENLKEAMKNNNVSIRKLTEAYGEKHPWLQRRLKSGKLTQTQLKDLIAQCDFLGKKSQ